MERRLFRPEANAKLFQQSILAPMRKGIIKAWHRTNRVAAQLGLTPEQLDHIYLESNIYGHREFIRLMVQDKRFRNHMIATFIEGRD